MQLNWDKYEYVFLIEFYVDVYSKKDSSMVCFKNLLENLNSLARARREKFLNNYRSADELIVEFNQLNIIFKSEITYFSVEDSIRTEIINLYFFNKSSFIELLEKSKLIAKNPKKISLFSPVEVREYFSCWLVSVKQLSNGSSKNYPSSIYSFEKICKEKGWSNYEFYKPVDLENTTNEIKRILEMEEFKIINEKKHRSFSATLIKYIEFLSYFSDLPNDDLEQNKQNQMSKELSEKILQSKEIIQKFDLVDLLIEQFDKNEKEQRLILNEAYDIEDQSESLRIEQEASKNIRLFKNWTKKLKTMQTELLDCDLDISISNLSTETIVDNQTEYSKNISNKSTIPHTITNTVISIPVKNYNEITDNRILKDAQGMLSQQEFVKMVDVQPETIYKYIQFKKIIPDKVVQISDSQSANYFHKDTVKKYANEFNWELITSDNIKEKFMNFVRRMTMTYSYKPVFLLAVIEASLRTGVADIKDVVEIVKSYYYDRLNNDLIAEKSNSIFQIGLYIDKDVKNLLINNPFKRFATMGFMTLCDNGEYIQIGVDIYNKLTKSDFEEIREVCNNKLDEYYKRLEN